MTDQQPDIEARTERLGWRVLNLSYLRNPHDLFAGVVYAVLIIGGIAIFVAALWMLGRTIGAIFDSARSPDDINKLLLGLAGLVGAPFVIWRVIIAARANRIATETAKENSRIAQENLYTSLLTKAVEQLGATREEKVSVKGDDGKIETEIKTVPNTEVRLGAIYALEKLARDYEPLHWPIMEILCAYVRKNCGPPPPEMSEEVRAAYRAVIPTVDQGILLTEWGSALRAPSVDVQAALTVIGRRGANRRAFEMKSRKASANPDAWRLDFTGAALMKARLEGLHFEEAIFDGAHLEQALIHRAHLEGARLVGTHLEGAGLYRAHLECARLRGARLDGARLDEVHLESAELFATHFESAMLMYAHLEDAKLIEVHLECARLMNAHLECAQLDGAYLEGALLYNASFKVASLARTQLTDANLGGASLDDAWLDGVDLSAVKNLTSLQLVAAWGDAATALPPGVERPVNERWLVDQVQAKREAEARDARWDAWRARRDYWLAEARKRREAEEAKEAALRKPLPEGEGRPGGPG